MILVFNPHSKLHAVCLSLLKVVTMGWKTETSAVAVVFEGLQWLVDIEKDNIKLESFNLKENKWWVMQKYRELIVRFLL